MSAFTSLTVCFQCEVNPASALSMARSGEDGVESLLTTAKCWGWGWTWGRDPTTDRPAIGWLESQCLGICSESSQEDSEPSAICSYSPRSSCVA